MPRTRSQRGRARGRISGWLAHLWADIRASTDPGFLAAARYLGLLYGRIDRRLPIDQALRKALNRRLAPHVGWRHALGGITYVLFVLLVVTGVLLSFYYRPSAEEAYASIQHIVSEVSLGWLVRDLHVWASNLIVVAILAHMARVFFTRAYRPPRETSWTVGLLLLLVVLAFGATGYLLPWDSWAFWTANEVVSRLAGVPLVGGVAARLLAGETFVAGATVSRFFVIHAIILPWIAFGLLAFHFAMIRKHGVAPPEGPPAEEPGVPFYPNHLLRSFMTSVLVLSVAITLAVLYPRPIGDPVAAFAEPSELVSTWIVVDVTLGLLRYVGPWGLVLYTLLGLSLFLIPLFDRSPEPRSRRRILVTAVGLLFFLGFLGAWVAGSVGR